MKFNNELMYLRMLYDNKAYTFDIKVTETETVEYLLEQSQLMRQNSQ